MSVEASVLLDLAALRRAGLGRHEQQLRAAVAGFGRMAAAAHAASQVMGDAAWVIRDAPRSRAARRAERRRVALLLRLDRRAHLEDAHWARVGARGRSYRAGHGA